MDQVDSNPSVPQPSLEEIIVENEKGVWRALQQSDGTADARLLADDFVGVYETGFASKADHVRWTGQGRVEYYRMADVRVMPFGREAALILYKAEFKGSQGGQPFHKTQYISSLWIRRSNRWWNVFSQDTDAK